MYKNPAQRVVAFGILVIACVAAISQTNPAAKDVTAPRTGAAQPATPSPGGGAAALAPGAPQKGEASTQTTGAAPRIKALLVAPSGDPASEHIALNGKLAVELDSPAAHPADQYVLFLNDAELTGVAPAVYTTLRNGKRALVFKLVRNSDNSTFWKELLGAPKHFKIPVTVALGERPEPCKAAQPCRSPAITITGGENPASFDFNLISWTWLAVAVVAVGFVVFLVWGHARSSTTLRDNLLPQLPPYRQPYSLARWQMAFWFVLIFASFIFLYILLWDYNTVSPQALGLMGISGVTALAAEAIDVAKDSPADAANRALQALGLNTYADVLRVQAEIAARQAQVTPRHDALVQAAAAQASEAAVAAPGKAGLRARARAAAEQTDLAHRQLQRLQAEIQDRQNILRTYEDKTRQFVSEGWLKDITTDLNGPTVHRIQVLCWTVALGLVFLVGVYHDLAMPPDFSPTLLALMGLSSAGYVGFKYPEKNN